jgi:hypothetical protein
MKKRYLRVNSERGQALILFVGVFTIIMLAGAIAVDFSLWFSERRGAQKDADLVTLAGVYELLDEAPDACVKAAEKSDEWAADNGLDPLDDIHNFGCETLDFPDDYGAEPGCDALPSELGRPNAVFLDIDHETRALFAELFGVAEPEIGAHACARAGSLTSGTGIRPWTVPRATSPCFGPDVDDYDGDSNFSELVPLYGETCIFRNESPESAVGSVRLGGCPNPGPVPCPEADPDSIECGPTGGGARNYEDNVVNGSPAECAIGDVINSQPGLATGPTFDALADLLAAEGDCDTENGSPRDGIDQFEESFIATNGSTAAPGPTVTFVPLNDCITPRAIYIIIVEEFTGNGQQDHAILGFAGFFLQQCEVVDPGDQNDPNDDVITAVYEKCDVPGGDRANAQIRGFFLSILGQEGDIGDFDEFGTKVIRLVE